MNVLAHIYLSGDSEKIIIGNYIGDYVKGRDYLKYPELVRKGIILHRHIDAFTDSHPVVHRSKIFFSRKYHETYQTVGGIKHVLNTLSNRSSLPNETRFAIRTLKRNYYSLQDDFMEFFPQLIDYVEKDFGIEISHRITMPF
ncbi:MAG: ACP phosphodiesterase [Bacteroidales bacterium]|nr:ACP phosphodiesterase [Bacteroidales bacterium]